MDNTAQNPQGTTQPIVQNPVAQSNTVPTPVVAQQSAGPVAPPQTNAAQPDTVSTSGNVPQTPVQPVPQQPISGGNPEQAPVTKGLPTREAAPVDETEVTATVSDDQAVVPDEAADADIKQQEAADVKLQESHPQVEVAKELQEAGVEKGEDAERDKLPEEQIAKPDDAAQQPDTQAAASGVTLPMSLQQAEDTKKKSKIRDSLKWLAELIIYEWRQLQVKTQTSDVKKPEEVVK